MTSDAVLLREIKRNMDAFMSACKKSEETKAEVGYDVCWDKGKKETKLSHVCMGEEGCIMIATCIKGNEFGTMHTHPETGLALLSPQDVVSSLNRGEAVACICGSKEKLPSAKDLKEDLPKDFPRAMAKNEKYRMCCVRFTDDEGVRKKFIKASSKDDDYTTMSMITEAELRPSDKTIYRTIYKKKR
jgi:hypothetical protein